MKSVNVILFFTIHVVFIHIWWSFLPQSIYLLYLCVCLSLYLYWCLYLYLCLCFDLYSICVLICIVFVFWFASYLCVYNDHVCASLPGPPLRARCLQTKMQIRDRVSGFSRKIEQIIAPAPLVTNPVEKYIFFSKKISPSRASSGTRLFEEKDNEWRAGCCTNMKSFVQTKPKRCETKPILEKWWV